MQSGAAGHPEGPFLLIKTNFPPPKATGLVQVAELMLSGICFSLEISFTF